MLLENAIIELTYKPFKIVKKGLYFFILVFLNNAITAQEISSLDSIKESKKGNISFNYKQLIIPAALVAYSVIGIENDGLKDLNLEIREEVTENIDKKITIDDFSQYAPALTVYGLNLAGIKGKNNLRDRSVIFATSYLIMEVLYMH